MSWLKRALTPPKWVRSGLNMSTGDIHDVLSPSGSLGNLYEGLSPTKPPVKNVVLNAQEQDMIKFAVIGLAIFLIFK